jgi:hypothetical protein
MADSSTTGIVTAPSLFAKATVTAPSLFAIARGSACEGKERCHWCGAACKQLFRHDEPDVQPFVKQPRSHALFFTSPWICIGCWKFRMLKTTINFLPLPVPTGKRNAKGTPVMVPVHRVKDGQCPQNYSWWLTSVGCWGVGLDEYGELFSCLLNTPDTFALTLLTDPSLKNLIELAPVNTHNDKPTETFRFLYNNVVHETSPYELDLALLQGHELTGLMPGTKLLADLFRPKVPLLEKPLEQPKGRGRPPGDDKQPHPDHAQKKQSA